MINRSMVVAGVIGGLLSLAGYQIASNTSQPSLAQPSSKTVPAPTPSVKALPQAATAVPQSAPPFIRLFIRGSVRPSARPWRREPS